MEMEITADCISIVQYNESDSDFSLAFSIVNKIKEIDTALNIRTRTVSVIPGTHKGGQYPFMYNTKD